MSDPTGLVPAVVSDEASVLADYAGYAGAGPDVHDVEEIRVPLLRWKLMGTSAGSKEGGKFYNTLENDQAYDEVPAVFLDGKNSRSYYAGSYDPKAKGPAPQPDCKSNDGVIGVGNPGGECAKCPLSKWGKDGTPPACSLSYDRLIIDFHTNQPGIMSFAKSKIRPLQDFEKARKARNAGQVPMWAYKVVIRSERKDAYWIPRIDIEGVLPKEEALRFYNMKQEISESFNRSNPQVVTTENIASAFDAPDEDAALAATAY